MLRPRFADSSFPTFSSRLSTRFSKPRPEDIWDDTPNHDVTADTSIEEEPRMKEPRKVDLSSSSRFASKSARLTFSHFPAPVADESTESLLNVIQNLTQAKRRLEAELKSSREILQEKDNTLNEANASLNNMSESMESTSSECEKIKNQLTKLKGEQSDLYEKVRMLEGEKKSQSKELLAKIAEVNECAMKLRQNEETINNLKMECSKKDSILFKMEQDTSALANQLFQEQSKVKCLERDMSTTRNQMEQSRQRDHQLQTSLQELMNGELNGTKKEIHSINSQLERLPSMLSSLEDKINRQSDKFTERGQEFKKVKEEIKRSEKVVCNQVKTECKSFSEESKQLLESISIKSQELYDRLQGAQASTTQDAQKLAKSLVAIAKTKDLTVLANKMKSLENEVMKSLKREQSLQETIRLTEENCKAACKERDDLRKEHQKCSLEMTKLNFTIKAFQQDQTPSKEWGEQLIAQLNEERQHGLDEEQENSTQKVQVPESQPVKRGRAPRSQKAIKRQKVPSKEVINSDEVKPNTANREIDEFDIFSDDSCDSQPFTATFSRRRP